MKYIVIPGEGMEEIKFGNSPDEIIDTLGPAADKDTDEDDDLFSVLWLYPQLQLTLFFEGEEIQQLVSIESTHPDTTLYGKKVFEMNEEALVQLMKSNGAQEMEAEDEAWGERRLSFDDRMIDFYFSDGKLITLNWSVIDEDDD